MFHREVPLSGLDVKLRLLESRHAPLLFALVDANRNHLRAWLPWVEATKAIEDTEAYIEARLAQFAAGESVAAGVWVGDRIAGVMATQQISWLDRRAEVGYWVSAEYEGRGLMTESARLLVGHLLGELGLNRVEIRCAVENTRSNRVPERLGFVLEGVERESHRIGSRFHDMNRWAMLQRDWKG